MPGMVDRYVFRVLELIRPCLVVVARLSEDQIVCIYRFIWCNVRALDNSRFTSFHFKLTRAPSAHLPRYRYLALSLCDSNTCMERSSVGFVALYVCSLEVTIVNVFYQAMF